MADGVNVKVGIGEGVIDAVVTAVGGNVAVELGVGEAVTDWHETRKRINKKPVKYFIDLILSNRYNPIHDPPKHPHHKCQSFHSR